MKRLILAAIVVLASAHGALAQSSQTSIRIEHSWARASAGKTGGAFLTIVNSAGNDDRLIGAETPVAAKAGKIATTVTVEKAGASSPAATMGKMQMQEVS
jgi:copper(I)-binding protein